MAEQLPEQPIPSEYLNTPGKHDASHKRDEKCVPIAFELIKLLAAQEKMPVGMHVNDKAGDPDVYMPTIHAFMKLLIEKDVKITESVYIFNLAREAIQYIQAAIDETLNQNMNRVTEMVYGLDHNDYNEVTVQQLNKVVMRSAEIKKVLHPDIEEAA